MKIAISEQALKDIENIWLYTLENWSAEQADRYYNLIFEEIEFICKNFNAGKSIEYIRKGYRSPVWIKILPQKWYRVQYIRSDEWHTIPPY